MRRMGIAVVLLASTGCFSPEITDEMPEDLPAPQCEDTDTDACAGATGSDEIDTGEPSGTSSSTGLPQADECEDTNACLGDGACVATWDTATTSRGPFECRFACVPTLDDSAWCSDDASCCEAAATCTARGYCILDESEGTSSSGGSTGQ